MEKLGDTASGRTGSPGRPGRRTVMSNHPFRFGATLFNVGSRSAWRDRVREVEDLGYDVLQVPDHLGMPSPFPALVAAADVTNMRLGTYVLNAGVVSPAYLARDVADVYRLTDGRLELGLGAGYVPAEVAAVGASADEVDLSIIRNASGLSDDQLVQLPGVLVGSPGEIADRLLRYRET